MTSETFNELMNLFRVDQGFYYNHVSMVAVVDLSDATFCLTDPLPQHTCHSKAPLALFHGNPVLCAVASLSGNELQCRGYQRDPQVGCSTGELFKLSGK